MYTGTSADQDTRFSDKEKKLLKQMKFSESLNAKVDMNKVKLDTIKPWIGTRITELLGMEDDVVEEFVNNQLEADNCPDPRKMQINLTGFLNGKNARVFMTDLWELLLSAQESPSGIPPKFIEQKKEELKKKMEDQERVGDMIKKFEKDKEDREKERKKERERRKSRSRSRTRDRRSRSRDRHRDKRDKEREKDKYNEKDDSDKVRDKHMKRDSRSKSKGKLVSNGHGSPNRKEESRSCSPKNDVSVNEDKLNNSKNSVSPTKDKVVETNSKPKRKERSSSRDSTKRRDKKRHHSSSSSCSSSSSNSSTSLDRKKDNFEIQKKKKKNAAPNRKA